MGDALHWLLGMEPFDGRLEDNFDPWEALVKT